MLKRRNSGSLADSKKTPGKNPADLSFKIFETDQFLKNLEQDFSGFGKNIKKLSKYKPQTWRYRIGGWRFFYQTDGGEEIVFMIAADSRQNAH